MDDIDVLTLEEVANIPPERRITILRTKGRDIRDVHDLIPYARYIRSKLVLGQPVTSVLNPNTIVSPRELRAVADRAHALDLLTEYHLALLGERFNIVFTILVHSFYVRLIMCFGALLCMQYWNGLFAIFLGHPLGNVSEMCMSIACVAVIMNLTREEVETIVWSFERLVNDVRVSVFNFLCGDFAGF